MPKRSTRVDHRQSNSRHKAPDVVQIFEGVIDVLEPIHHGGDEKTGSTPVLRSLRHWDDQAGEFVSLPFISGNAIRGVVRRLLFRDLLDRVGYENNSKKLHHALFSGGVLEKTGGEGDDDLEFRRWCRDRFPPIALLGLSIGNQILTSCLKVGHARLVCREYRSALPAALQEDPRASRGAREFTDVSFATRRDDLRDKRDKDEQATQMKIDFECLISGARLAHRFVLEHATALESSCLAHAVALWNRDPHIGAKSASGYGRVRLHYEHLPAPDLYEEFLSDEREQLRADLDRLAAACEAPAQSRSSRKSTRHAED